MHGAIEDVFRAQAENEVSARRGGLEILRVQTEFAGGAENKKSAGGNRAAEKPRKVLAEKQKNSRTVAGTGIF